MNVALASACSLHGAGCQASKLLMRIPSNAMPRHLAAVWRPFPQMTLMIHSSKATVARKTLPR